VANESDMRAFAKQFFDAVQNGDIDAIRASYAPNVKIWHNTDGLETTREENVATLTGFIQRIPRRSYENRRVQVFDGGFIQQHDLRGVRADGVEAVLPACIICLVQNGAITRLDEYFDSAHVARFIASART
jgi:ketosteroid isomerase-like protein